MTPEEIQVLDAVREWRQVRGWSPSYQELATTLGTVKSVVYRRAQNLIAQGKLRTTARKRGLEVADDVDLRTVGTEELKAELARRGLTFQRLVNDTSTPSRSRHAVTCALDGCSTEVRRGMLFCRQHWFALPHTLREGILAAFGRRDQQEYGLLFNEARELLLTVRRS